MKKYIIEIEEITTCNGCIFSGQGYDIKEAYLSEPRSISRCRLSNPNNPNWVTENMSVEEEQWSEIRHKNCPLNS